MNPNSEVALGFRSFTYGQHKEFHGQDATEDHVRLLFKLMSWGAQPLHRKVP